MRIAYVHEWWGAGATRCVADLSASFGKTDEVLVVPDGLEATPASIWSQLRNFRPDLLHCHSFYGHRGLPYSDLALLTRLAPTVYTIHDPRPIGIMNDACWDCAHQRYCVNCPLTTPARRLLPPLNTYFRARLKKNLTHRRARSDTRIIAPSRWIMGRLQATELRRFEHRHIPYGIDLALFHPDVPPHPFRNSLPPGTPVVLHAAYSTGIAVNERKGLADLWEAFRRVVLPRLPNARLAIVGEGAVPNHPDVIALGQVTPAEMPALFNACDLYVTATRADNLPYTVLEAMACGKAVVGTRIGGVPEMVTDSVTGKIVPARAPDELGRAILDLLTQPEMCRQMGRRGAETVSRDFGLAQFVDRHRTLYQEVMQSRQTDDNP